MIKLLLIAILIASIAFFYPLIDDFIDLTGINKNLSAFSHEDCFAIPQGEFPLLPILALDAKDSFDDHDDSIRL